MTNVRDLLHHLRYWWEGGVSMKQSVATKEEFANVVWQAYCDRDTEESDVLADVKQFYVRTCIGSGCGEYPNTSHIHPVGANEQPPKNKYLVWAYNIEGWEKYLKPMEAAA